MYLLQYKEIKRIQENTFKKEKILMSDFYKKMLQKSIEREAKRVSANGATEKSRYGNLLDCVKGRDLDQEEKDRIQGIVSNIQESAEVNRKQRESEAADMARNIRKNLIDIENREKRQLNDYLIKHKTLLDKGREVVRREQEKTYFS